MLPLPQTGSAFPLWKEGEKLYIKIVFIRKQILGKNQSHHLPMKMYTYLHQWVMVSQEAQSVNEEQCPTHLVALHSLAASWCTGRGEPRQSWAGQALPLLSHVESFRWDSASQFCLAVLKKKMRPVRPLQRSQGPGLTRLALNEPF